MATFWVILVTDGTLVEYPPEVYASRNRALVEARRWSWLLSAGGQTPIRTRFEERWEVGFRDVRLVSAVIESRVANDTWVGTFWTHHGYPDPEAILLSGRSSARIWCLSPLRQKIHPTHVDETEWSVSATFGSGDSEEVAVANLAKVVGGNA